MEPLRRLRLRPSPVPSLFPACFKQRFPVKRLQGERAVLVYGITCAAVLGDGGAPGIHVHHVVDELKALAEAEGVDITGKTTKDAITEALTGAGVR